MLRATALSLQEFPELNARLEGDEIVYLDRYDLAEAEHERADRVPVALRRRGASRGARGRDEREQRG